MLEIRKKHEDITEVSVEGHTDNRGGVGHYMDLSRRRAAAVVDWLVGQRLVGQRLVGQRVDKSRLTSKGWGQSKPIDDNAKPEGRQNNRRVEFHIVKRNDESKSGARR